MHNKQPPASIAGGCLYGRNHPRRKILPCFPAVSRPAVQTAPQSVGCGEAAFFFRLPPFPAAEGPCPAGSCPICEGAQSLSNPLPQEQGRLPPLSGQMPKTRYPIGENRAQRPVEEKHPAAGGRDVEKIPLRSRKETQGVGLISSRFSVPVPGRCP